MTPEEFRLQVERILLSQTFSQKAQMQKLLRILFEHRDRQAMLKPDRIILELWGEHSPSRTSANLATEINRLRRMLDSYYRDEGSTDPVLVSLPARTPHARHLEGRCARWIDAAPNSPPGADCLSPNSSLGVMHVSLPPEEDTGASPSNLRALHDPARLFRWKLLAGVSVLLLLTLLSLYLIVPRGVPQAARIDGNMLRVFDQDGNELWHKMFSEGFWNALYQDETRTRFWFGDLDGNGRTSMLFLYHPAIAAESHSTTLICYSEKGKEKWRWTVGRPLPELDGGPPFFKAMDLAVFRPAGSKSARILVSSYHIVYFPHQIALLDAQGKSIAEYWHSGHLDWMKLADLSQDGRPQIFATGVSNGYRQATLVVLDVDRVEGASAEVGRPEMQIHGMPIAQERARILFPRSDVGIATMPYNAALDPAIDHGILRLSVRDLSPDTKEQFWYQFNRNFRLVDAQIGDGFRNTHDAYYRNSRHQHALSGDEEALLKQVACLSGCGTDQVARTAPTGK